MQGPECLLGTRGVDGTPKAAPFLSLLSTCWQLSSLYVGLVLLWPHRLGWPHSLCSGLSLSCPRGPQTSGPITGPPKECLWAAAPVAVEVGSRSAPFVQTLVFLSEADRAEVSRFAKNFLPILFNLYGQPAAAGEGNMTERLHFHFSLSCIGEGNGNPFSVLAWRIPGTEEPGRRLSMGSHKVGHD